MNVFISYSRRDGKITDDVCRELEDQGHSVRRDVSHIPGGADWRAFIARAICEADAFVVLLLPRVNEHPKYDTLRACATVLEHTV